MGNSEDREFKYEVAISLLEQDLAVAKEIEALLKDRARVFLYSERPAEIAGSDGAETFSAPFRRDAKVVVLLAREQWGKTKWTRVEQSAITSRGLDEGWDFLFVIALEGKPGVPLWVPETYIWGDLGRYGAAGAVAVIERKLAEAGTVLRPETAEDIAARIARRKKEEQEVRWFLEGPDGFRAAEASFGWMKEQFATRGKAMGIRLDIRDRDITLTSGYKSVSVHWSRRYADSLRDSALVVKKWNGVLNENISRENRATKAVSQLELEFDVRAGEHVWKVAGRSDRFFTSDNLADHILKVALLVGEGERAPL